MRAPKEWQEAERRSARARRTHARAGRARRSPEAVRRRSARLPTAQPATTAGISARAESSVRKIATPNDTGTAIAMASSDDTTVPDERQRPEDLAYRIPVAAQDEPEPEGVHARDRRATHLRDHHQRMPMTVAAKGWRASERRSPASLRDQAAQDPRLRTDQTEVRIIAHPASGARESTVAPECSVFRRALDLRDDCGRKRRVVERLRERLSFRIAHQR